MLQYELQRWREGNKEEEVEVQERCKERKREREGKKEKRWGVIRTL